MEEDKSTKAAGCKKNVTRLHRSFLHGSTCPERSASSTPAGATRTPTARRRCLRRPPQPPLRSSPGACIPGPTPSPPAAVTATSTPTTAAAGRGTLSPSTSGPSGSASPPPRLPLSPATRGGSSSAQDYCCYGDGGSEADDEPKAVVRDAGGGVAVATLSVAPYEDFRRSMREMVDAAARSGAAAPAAVDWDFMEELLFCYLRLNDRAVHKDILCAFTDTVAAIRRRQRRRAAKSRRTRRRQRRQTAGDSRGDDSDGAEAVTSISS